MPKRKPLEKTIDEYLMDVWRKMGGWVMKVHGNEFTGSGIPDLVGCVPIIITEDMVGDTIGAFVAIEDKRDEDHEPSPIQVHTIEEIKKAKGYAVVAHSKAEGREALEEARLVSKGRGRVCDPKAVRRALHGARNGKNVGGVRNNRTAPKRRKRRVNRRATGKH